MEGIIQRVPFVSNYGSIRLAESITAFRHLYLMACRYTYIRSVQTGFQESVLLFHPGNGQAHNLDSYLPASYRHKEPEKWRKGGLPMYHHKC